MSFQETFDINYYYHYYTFIDWIQKKSFTKLRQIQLMKLSQKRGKIVNINFLLYLKFYQSFKNFHEVKWSKTYLVKYILHHHQGQFSGTTNLDVSFTSVWKKILCHIFLFLCHVLSLGSSGLNCEFIIYGVRFFDKFENVIHGLRW